MKDLAIAFRHGSSCAHEYCHISHTLIHNEGQAIHQCTQTEAKHIWSVSECVEEMLHIRIITEVHM